MIIKNSITTLIVSTMIVLCQVADADNNNLTNLRVLASIKPIYSLVDGVMAGTGSTPELLLEDSDNPHHFVLKPSQAQKIAQADLIFYIGDEFETMLAQPLAAVPQKAISLMKIPKLLLLPSMGCGFSNEGWHQHKITSHDPHIWLSPRNAIVIVEEIEKRLAQRDPKHAKKYKSNAQQLIKQIKKLDKKLLTILDFPRKPGYLVLHNGYQYFEQHYKLHNLGCVFHDIEIPLSGQQLSAIEKLIKSGKVECIFAEPQLEASTMGSLFNAKNIEYGRLDPLGVELSAGPNTYIEIMQNLAESFALCFKKADRDLRGGGK